MCRKILSLVFAVFMVCSVSVFSVSADELLAEIETLEYKCKTELIEEYTITDVSCVDVYFAEKLDNYTVFFAQDGPHISTEKSDYINGYWFYIDTTADYYTLDNYGNVETLKETALKGFVDMDEVFERLEGVADMYLLGDIDGDRALTVKDATFVQKCIAKIPEAVDKLNSHPVNFHVADADISYVLDGDKPNIKDVTCIQKRIAKIGIPEDVQTFAYDQISICFYREDVKQYSLADFPEYEFESIERWDSEYGGLTILTLYLKNPGRENVLDAMNSLKYREGEEFDVVDVKHFEYASYD